jgi:DNA-binding PadR family transcriptional regulator
MPLDRLEKRGLLDSYLTDPTPERGGRSKRVYTPTKKGLVALEEIRKIHEAAWKGMQRKTTDNI